MLRIVNDTSGTTAQRNALLYGSPVVCLHDSGGQMHISWVNRNYKYTAGKREYTGSILKAGEFHWQYDGTLERRGGGSLSWHWGTNFCHVRITLGGGDGNDEISISLGIPYVVALWFHHTLPVWVRNRLPQHYYQVPRYQQLSPVHNDPQVHHGDLIGYDEGSYPESREISLRFHDWAVWWTLWMNNNEWRSTDPKWRRDSFHVDDALLGSRKYLCNNLGPPLQSYVRMLEGEYPVILQRQRQTWWRTRWPWWPFRMVRESFDVRCEVGIPFPGKGEDSWNCGDDGLFGTAFDVATQEKACAKYQDVVLKYRKRYGGERCAEEPWPQTATERVREYHERLQQHETDVAQQRGIASTEGHRHGSL